MIPRVLEPEVMDTAAEAEDYDAMDHRAVNEAFVDDLLAALQPVDSSGAPRLELLDCGTGTALIPIALCRCWSGGRVTAIDLAEQMLRVARRNVADARLQDRIALVRVDSKAMPYANDRFDAVISNSIVHHIHEPAAVLAEMWRVLRPGGLLFVRDLLRPESVETLEQLVATYAGKTNAHQQQMFRDSLHAALTVAEIGGMLDALGLDARRVRATSDRHWTIVCRKPSTAARPTSH